MFSSLRVLFFSAPAQCVEQFGTGFQALLEGAGLSTEAAAAVTAEATTLLSSTILAFWSWG